ncbi:MAG TPA: LLM class flavin-dependent oxidoreductase [Dehalococcoidia bacterium]|nr:LLM class flavin-dependent oxidoreductase [Dehalococcoidia bacterium]
MKFGLFYELQLPKPYDSDTWDPDAEHRIYKEALEQIELADKLGFDYVFEVEHHHLEEYAHSSAPEIVLAAASQRTRNIRLGHGIVLTPPPYNHPGRVAERISALDLVSDGRVEFGTGESSSANELEAYHVPWDQKKAMWEEGTRVALRMMSEEPFPGYEGAYVTFPPRNVIPKPLQKPHPPVWVAGGRRETVLTAARLGMGSLGFGFETPAEADERVQTYWRLMREECRPIGKAVNPGLIVLSQFACAETEEEAQRRAGDGGQFFSFALNHFYSPLTGPYHNHARTNLFREFTDTPPEERMARLQARSQDQLSQLIRTEQALTEKEPEDENARALWRAARARAAIGTPDTLRAYLSKYEEGHQDVMLFIAQAGSRRHEDIMASIDLFGRKVLPDFKERHETVHKKWREQQLDNFKYPVNSSI